MDETFAKMRMNCQRIAKVLGLDENGVPAAPTTSQVPADIHASPRRDEPLSYANLNNPSMVRPLVPPPV